MSEGSLRSRRSLLVSQATLVWADDTIDTESFVRTGSFSGSSQAESYDPELRAMIVQQYQAAQAEEPTP